MWACILAAAVFGSSGGLWGGELIGARARRWAIEWDVKWKTYASHVHILKSLVIAVLAEEI